MSITTTTGSGTAATRPPTAVILGIDDDFGLALVRSFLEIGGTIFGGTEDPGAPVIAALSTQYSRTFHAIAVDPASILSVTSAAAILKQADISVDMLICNVDRRTHDSLEDGLDFDAMKRTFDINALAPIRFMEAFLPLTKSGLKRLCFVTSAMGSLGTATGGRDFAYSMSKTSLNRTVMIMSNHLSKEGYTFRVFIPNAGGTESARSARDYFLNARDDEFRLVIVDDKGHEWPF